jgi:hypothetical protein
MTSSLATQDLGDGRAAHDRLTYGAVHLDVTDVTRALPSGAT